MKVFAAFAVIFVSVAKRQITGNTNVLDKTQVDERDTGHSEHIYMNLKLDKILEILREDRRGTSKPADGSLNQKVEKIEQQFEQVLQELKDINIDLLDVKQNTNTKYHELRQDINDNFENTNTKFQDLNLKINDMTGKVLHLKKSINKDAQTSGTTYTRWGRTICPGNGSEITYSGYAGGSWYTHQGAAASMLCLPKDPNWNEGKYSDKHETSGYVYGAEFEVAYYPTSFFGSNLQDNDVQCVVCNVKGRSSHIMIPGKTQCNSGWTYEYSGFLMSGYYNHVSAADYYCIDGQPESVEETGTVDDNGYVLYLVESRCGSLPCPPYVDGREMPCVVCTK